MSLDQVLHLEDMTVFLAFVAELEDPEVEFA